MGLSLSEIPYSSCGLVRILSQEPYELEANSIGINDAHRSYFLDNVVELMEKDVDEYFKEIQALYDLGARQFIFLNVPRKRFVLTMRGLAHYVYRSIRTKSRCYSPV